jgi:dipeptidyl aminopeptidase/acylaminoacyl peptidase
MLPLLVAGLASVARAVEPGAVGENLRVRYERAVALQNFAAARLVPNQEVYPSWIDGTDSFWYKRETAKGYRVIIVDAARGGQAEAFDPSKLAARLAKETGKTVDAEDLPLAKLRLALSPAVASFSAFGKDWTYEIVRDKLDEIKGTTKDLQKLLVSPDGSKAGFLKESNLWLRDLKTGEEKPLTSDGAQYYAYGVVPEATRRTPERPEAMWSPDSTKIFTTQVDERQVKEMPMIDFAPKDGTFRPRAFSVRTALPGDEHVTTFRMVILEVKSGKQVPVHYPPIPAVRMYDTPFGGGRAWWSADGRLAYFVEIERSERTVRVVACDTATGETRTLFEETSDQYVELGSNVYPPASIVPLPATNELVWYSERTGWAHLYLYDLKSGQLKRLLTSGSWLVRDVLGFDSTHRELYITIAGREPGRNPYYREVARVNLDSSELTILSSSDADHKVRSKRDFDVLGLSFLGDDIDSISGVSPNGSYFVETVTRADRPSKTVLCDRGGKQIMVVETADTSRLPKGWKWPEPVKLTAADGRTEIWGLVFRPSDFGPDRSYPVIDLIYGGPQISNVPESFVRGTSVDAASLAELGFVVVVIDGRGTAERDRAFHEASYGAVQTGSNLEDHIAGIRQLAERYPYMDPSRVGITGFSAGGYMAASALLRFPEFFKVGVAGGGNYDQRLFWNSWGERYQGLLEGDNYSAQADATYAKKLQGKLMFIHGLLDSGCHPSALFQLTQALINENKDFDLVLLPQAGHQLPGYALRRMWDYFVRNLAGAQPPEPMVFKSQSDYIVEKMKENRGEGDQAKKAGK